MTEFRVIIPARFASTRLPGKPLQDIAGKTMIQRVYEQARKSSAADVVIATDDVRIEQAAHEFGATVVMTSAQHESGTDRLQEVVSQLGLADDAIVVNVQGDEPLIPPKVIDQVAQNLANSDAGISTLSEVIDDAELVFDPNVVKVVSDINGYAMYFSRAPIPWCRASYQAGRGELPTVMSVQRHIGIYGYRVGLLHDFVKWGPCPLEKTESLEQLRAMWHGVKIHVQAAVETPPAGVDTAEDLERVRRLLQISGRS